MNQDFHGKKLESSKFKVHTLNQDTFEEIIYPKAPSLTVLNQRWQKIRQLLLQEISHSTIQD